MKQEYRIFLGVFIAGFVIYLAFMSRIAMLDDEVWADQIRYFLTHDARAVDIHGAYGHPGTTIVELGSVFHLLFNVSYLTAERMSTGVLIAGATAASSVLCFVLYPGSPWWLATALTLLLNRMTVTATPPTAIAMPFTVLLVLATWRLWRRTNPSRLSYALWGAIAGVAMATRIDIALFVGGSMTLLLWYRGGAKSIVPLIAGWVLAFAAADPFLWFMPVRHMTDFYYKFTMHYTYHGPIRSKLHFWAMMNASWVSIVCLCWAAVLLLRKQLERILPVHILIAFSCSYLMSLTVVLSSEYQTLRYLYPLIVVWDVLLPLFALETLTTYTGKNSAPIPHQKTIVSSYVVVLAVLLQLMGIGAVLQHLSN